MSYLSNRCFEISTAPDKQGDSATFTAISGQMQRKNWMMISSRCADRIKHEVVCPLYRLVCFVWWAGWVATQTLPPPPSNASSSSPCHLRPWWLRLFLNPSHPNSHWYCSGGWCDGHCLLTNLAQDRGEGECKQSSRQQHCYKGHDQGLATGLWYLSLLSVR